MVTVPVPILQLFGLKRPGSYAVRRLYGHKPWPSKAGARTRGGGGEVEGGKSALAPEPGEAEGRWRGGGGEVEGRKGSERVGKSSAARHSKALWPSPQTFTSLVRIRKLPGGLLISWSQRSCGPGCRNCGTGDGGDSVLPFTRIYISRYTSERVISVTSVTFSRGKSEPNH